MKIGVIGCGTIANAAHIPAYLKNPDAEIKYFCDILPERAQAAVEKYGCGHGGYGLSRGSGRPRNRRRFGLHAQ